MIQSDAATDIGSRLENQDRLLFEKHLDRSGSRICAIVCDGVGGHVGGAAAAGVASAAFAQAWKMLALVDGDDGREARLRTAISIARGAVADHQAVNPQDRGMATTLLAAEIGPEGLSWASVGDSPLYVRRAGEASVTRVNELHHRPEQPNAVTSVIDGKPITRVDLQVEAMPLGPGDTVIAASDGIGTLDESEIAEVAADQRSAATKLVDAVIGKGRKNQDNVSVIAVRIPDATAARARPAAGEDIRRAAGMYLKGATTRRELLGTLFERLVEPTGSATDEEAACEAARAIATAVTQLPAPKTTPAENPPATTGTIYTDGSAVPNPGAGGWAAVWVDGGRVVHEASGREPETTNNRMELRALIAAYSMAPAGAALESRDRQPVVREHADEVGAGMAARRMAQEEGRHREPRPRQGAVRALRGPPRVHAAVDARTRRKPVERVRRPTRERRPCRVSTTCNRKRHSRQQAMKRHRKRNGHGADPQTVIAALRNSHEHARGIFRHGGCYELYRILRSVWNDAEAWYIDGHVYTKIDGRLYDIDGPWTPTHNERARLALRRPRRRNPDTCSAPVLNGLRRPAPAAADTPAARAAHRRAVQDVCHNPAAALWRRAPPDGNPRAAPRQAAAGAVPYGASSGPGRARCA